jgi:hypothetical protein
MQGPSDRGESAVPADAVIQIGRVVGSSVSSKTAVVLYNVEGIGAVDRADATSPTADQAEGAGEANEAAELFGTLGLVVRPLPPTQTAGRTGHMEVASIRTADGLVPFAARDVRLHASFPNPDPGDIALVGYGSNFVRLMPGGGIALATTTDGTPTGEFVQLQLKGDGFALFGPWGKLVYDQTGLHLLHYSGARIDMGGIGGLPAPLGAFGSYANIGAAMIRLTAATVTLGSDVGSPEPVAKAIALQAVLTAISAAATAEAAAMTALAAVPEIAITPAAAACTTAAAALAAVVAAVLAGVLTIPSQSTSAT